MLTREDYFTDTEHMNNSAVSTFIDSPLRYYHEYVRRDHKREDSESMLLGRALHTFVLESARFHEQYVVVEKMDKRTKQGKADWAALQAKLEGKKIDVLTVDQHELVLEMAAGLLRNDYVVSIAEASQHEQVIETPIAFEMRGRKAKALPDLVIPSAGLIVDIKTTEFASPTKFRKSFESWGYHRQAYWYRNACRQKYDREFTFVFIVVGRSFPNESATYIPSESFYDIAELEVMRAMNAIEDRERANNWLSEWSNGTLELRPSKYYVPYQVGVVDNGE